MAQTQKSLHATMIGTWGSFANFLTSVNTFADVGHFGSLFFKTTRFYFSSATNNLTVQILGSIDGGVTFTEVVEAAFPVTTSTPVTKTITDIYTNLKVQVKPTVNDTHGTLTTKFMGVSA